MMMRRQKIGSVIRNKFILEIQQLHLIVTPKGSHYETIIDLQKRFSPFQAVSRMVNRIMYIFSYIS